MKASDMPTDLENLKTAFSNVCKQLADITENAKPTYNIDGQTVSWGDHFRNLLAAKKSLAKAIQQHEPYEEVSYGYT